MQITQTENGDICISGFEVNRWKDERARIMRLLNMANRDERSKNYSLDENGYILRALEFALVNKNWTLDFSNPVQ